MFQSIIQFVSQIVVFLFVFVVVGIISKDIYDYNFQDNYETTKLDTILEYIKYKFEKQKERVKELRKKNKEHTILLAELNERIECIQVRLPRTICMNGQHFDPETSFVDLTSCNGCVYLSHLLQFKNLTKIQLGSLTVVRDNEINYNLIIDRTKFSREKFDNFVTQFPSTVEIYYSNILLNQI